MVGSLERFLFSMCSTRWFLNVFAASPWCAQSTNLTLFAKSFDLGARQICAPANFSNTATSGNIQQAGKNHNKPKAANSLKILLRMWKSNTHFLSVVSVSIPRSLNICEDLRYVHQLTLSTPLPACAFREIFVDLGQGLSLTWAPVSCSLAFPECVLLLILCLM